jgi:hypothetical protein
MCNTIGGSHFKSGVIWAIQLVVAILKVVLSEQYNWWLPF